MPTVRTFTTPPFKDSVLVKIPKELQSRALEIIVLPAMEPGQEYLSNQVLDESFTCSKDDTEWPEEIESIAKKIGAIGGEPYKFNRADAYPEGEFA